MRNSNYRKSMRQRGATAVEFALILPILIVLAFGIIDFARFIKARVTVTDIGRETGNLASRDSGFKIDNALGITKVWRYLNSVWKIDNNSEDWRVYVDLLTAGTDSQPPSKNWMVFTRGQLNVPQSTTQSNFGLSDEMYNHLIYDPGKGEADIPELTVVEVYYKYRPITPLPNFIAGILLKDGDGIIVRSISYF